MKKPFERLTAHGCAIYKGEQQVATTDPASMSGADGDEIPSMEDIALAKMLAAAPDTCHALWSILRCPKVPAPHGISAYAIPDDLMDKARGAMLLAGIEVEKIPVMKCKRCEGSGEEEGFGIRVLCPNCNGRGER